jgi:hypothetical protein
MAKISDETKRLAKEKAAQSKAEVLEENALAYMPKDREIRAEEIIFKRDRLKEQIKEASADLKEKLKEENKRVRKVYGVQDTTDKIVSLYRGCKSRNEFNAVHLQVSCILATINWPLPAQGELNLEAVGKGVQEDEGSLFDQTGVGERQKKERPEERPRPSPNGSIDPRAPSPAMPLDEAQAKFEEASKSKFKSEEQIAQEKVEKKAQRQKDADEFEQQTNVVDLHPAQPKRRGRPPMTAEQKAKKAAERQAAGKVPSKESVSAAADRAEKKPKPPKMPAKEVAKAVERAEAPLEKPILHASATDAQRQVFETKWEENKLAAIAMARVINNICEKTEAKGYEEQPQVPLDDDLPEIAEEPAEPSGGYGVVI